MILIRSAFRRLPFCHSSLLARPVFSQSAYIFLDVSLFPLPFSVNHFDFCSLSKLAHPFLAIARSRNIRLASATELFYPMSASFLDFISNFTYSSMFSVPSTSAFVIFPGFVLNLI